MEKVELKIVALSHSVTKSHNYAVVLGENSGERRLPIVIGGFEAQAIAVALESMSPNRPLTHDLFKNALESFNVEVKEIIINNLLDGIFYAQLVCESISGQEVVIDSRTSDAIALAVRFGSPIYTYEFILEQAGVIIEDEKPSSETSMINKPQTSKSKSDKPYSSYSTHALNKMLNDVLASENYEKAAKIRDEINKRTDGES